MAGVLPGLLMAACSRSGAWSARRSRIATSRASRAPPCARPPTAIRKAAWALALPVFVLGGMYAGLFTATEAAAAGAWLAIVIAVFVYRTVGWRAIWEAALDACRVSAMLFMILAGAAVFGHVLTKLRLPQQIVQSVGLDGHRRHRLSRRR